MNRPHRKIDSDGLTDAELLDLDRRIVERSRMLDPMCAPVQMMEFNMDDHVLSQPPGCEVLRGILAHYDRKSVTVITDDGQRWNVGPGSLRKTQ